MKQVVVAGGGFGGIVAARKLAKIKNLEVILVTESEQFRYCPSMYRVATGYLRRQAIIPIADLLPTNVKIVISKVEHINRTARVLSLSNGHSLQYDYCILSLGVATSYFGISGLEEFAYGIKSVSDLSKLHDHLHQQLVAAHRPDTNYVVVGGGPTGIELSASLISYLKKLAKDHHVKHDHIKVELVEAAPRLVPMLSEKASKKAKKRLESLGIKVMVNSKVESETAKSLSVNGRSIPTKTVVWTAGVTNNPFYKQNERQFVFSKRGKIEVDAHLKVDPHVYVIGDNAETPYSGMAQVAILQGEYASEDISARMNHNKVKPFHNAPPVYVVPIGRNWAIMQWHGLVMGNFIGGMVRRAADFIGYSELMGPIAALKLWMQTDQKEDNCIDCDDANKHAMKVDS